MWIPCGIPYVKTTQWHTWHQKRCCKQIIMLNLVFAHILHLILETDFYLYSHKWLYFLGFQICYRCFHRRSKACLGDVVQYILKQTIDRKDNYYNGAPWVHCSQKLETHSDFFIQVLLPKKPTCCLIGVKCCLVQAIFSWHHPNMPWWE
jgi:hypothetical protein